jgi:hypothetical protein
MEVVGRNSICGTSQPFAWNRWDVKNTKASLRIGGSLVRIWTQDLPMQAFWSHRSAWYSYWPLCYKGLKFIRIQMMPSRCVQNGLSLQARLNEMTSLHPPVRALTHASRPKQLTSNYLKSLSGLIFVVGGRWRQKAKLAMRRAQSCNNQPSLPATEGTG